MREIHIHNSTDEYSAAKAAAEINHRPRQINLALTSLLCRIADVTSLLNSSS
jgi:hypothetical protein